MISLRDRIVKRLDQLPESNLREVLNFVEFMTRRSAEQNDPLFSVAGILSGEVLSADEIEQRLYGDEDDA